MTTYPPAIMFDLDDTLISFDGASGPAWDKCCEDFVAAHSPPFAKEQLLSAIKRTRRWYWSDPVRHKRGRENLIQARREVVSAALPELGVTDTELANELADNYSIYQNSLISLFPNTVATLTQLISAGVRLALITNGASRDQREKLARFDLARFFEAILIDQEIGYGKPDVRIYGCALSVLMLSAKDAWMVGDNLLWDVKGAQDAGIYAIWNDYRRVGLPADSAVKPDRIITDISELLLDSSFG